MTEQEIFRLKRAYHNSYDVYFENTGEKTLLNFNNQRVSKFIEVGGEQLAELSGDELISLANHNIEDFVVVIPVSNPELDWVVNKM